MVRGDAYNIEIEIRNGNTALTANDVELVEITIHDLVKTYPGKVTFEDGKFLFPLSQEETFGLPFTCLAQIRVKFPGGDVIGSEIQQIDVRNALSQAVL